MPDTPPLQAFIDQINSLDPADLKTLIERRHPLYAFNAGQWEFFDATYQGGREWFPGNIFKYIKEGDTEYLERVSRAYRFNHTREVVELVNKYIFKGEIARNEDASQNIQTFWKYSTMNRRPIRDFMELVSSGASVFGRIWVCVDSNQTNKDATLIEDQISGARVYAYTIKPQNVLDLSWDKDGTLSWIKLTETQRDDDTIFDAGDVRTQYRIWTKRFWALFEEVPNPTDPHQLIYQLVEAGEHNLGRVPFFPVDHIPTDDLYVATGLIDDIAYLDRAVANYLSNLDAIIQDQTFSQLVMPAQALLPGNDTQTQILEMGTKRIFTFDAAGTFAPQYISPDASQAQLVLNVINKVVSEIYHSIGMAGERTKQDNSMGIDNSSGVAKAFDFDRVNAMLARKARSIEIAENSLCELVDTWFGVTVIPGTYDYVTYPDNFDVRGLSDEIDLATELLTLEAPDPVRQQQMLTVVDKLFPNLGQAVIKKMKDFILNQWPPQEADPASKPTSQVKETTGGGAVKITGTLTA